jgi:two-component sensor histidine kinase
VLVQPLSIVLHELATNATKYGALSTAGGTLEIAWEILRSRRALSLRWTEQGGPVIPGVPERRGFGSRVIEQTMRRQLGGTCTLHWRPEGLLFEAEVPLPQTNALAGTPLPPPGPPPRGAGRPALSTLPADYPRRSTA